MLDMSRGCGCDPHSKACRKMSGVACGITVSQGESWGFTEVRWRLRKGSALYLEEGNKEVCGPRALELDSQMGLRYG